ncbi:helix-turn-helix domain-containing protein [Leptospira neocaledonica]|uniref:Transcriptional regulator n=1 Tax=Leptospira neocaledonica TaxID=2023192 RepID=A0A2N0A3B5_9LEPT|nr:helix-turn-helix transcriptional regulator [Leptospira neocaledonica]PJZ78797.1 transcriptional regulator [Leptospira neocaledonica]
MDYSTFKNRVCKRIKELRIEKNLTQEQVSGMNMGVRTYQKIESGINAPNLESLFKIADALGVHPKDLINVPLSGFDEKSKRK